MTNKYIKLLLKKKTTNIDFNKDFDKEQQAKYNMCCICMEPFDDELGTGNQIKIQ